MCRIMAELLKFNRQEIEELIQQGRKNKIIKYDLRGADLHGLDLSDMDLADLYGANLNSANLNSANLSHTNLENANLCDANLCKADLVGTNLGCAYLTGANLNGANLQDARLMNANLNHANLTHVDLNGGDLTGADLSGANLCEANLAEANLEGVKYDEDTSFFALQCPEKGSFIGFKKADGYIVELEIPANAKRSSATSRKCRCSEAKVSSITKIDGTDDGRTQVSSSFNPEFIYEIGKIVKVDDFDDERWNACSKGIHFFMTRDEAVKY